MKRFNREFIVWLAVVATFLLIARLGQIKSGIIKPFDLLMIIIGAYFFSRREIWFFLKEIKKEWRPFVFYLGALFIFFIIGQVSGFFSGAGVAVVTKDIILNHLRALFNSGIFFLTAFLIVFYPNLLAGISRAAFFSPILIVPVFFGFGQQLYFDGGRLSGLTNNANIFAGWFAVIFIIGLYFVLFSSKWWLRAFSFGWLSIVASFIIWSGSRASWIAVFAGFFTFMVFVLLRKKEIIFLYVIPAVTLGTFFVGFFLLSSPVKNLSTERFIGLIQTPTHNQSRVEIWQQVIPVIIQHPFGSGFDYFTLDNNKIITYKETIIFTTNALLEAGVVGGWGAIALVLILIIHLNKRVFQRFNELSMLEIAWFSAFIALMVSIVFIDGFLFRHVWFMLGVIFGITLKKHHEAVN